MDFIREAGFGIWPVMAFGALAAVLAAAHALRPRPERMALIVGASLLTLLFGALGTVMGIQMSARYLDQVADADRWIFVVGLRESLNNLVAALLVVSVTCLLATLGAYRGRLAASRPMVQPAR